MTTEPDDDAASDAPGDADAVEASRDDASASAPTSTFADLGVEPALAATLAALGYEEPTPVQCEAIPALLAGRDLLGQAATGTGKTAAFALPMLQRFLATRSEPEAPGLADAAAPPPRGLVIVPTRELAMQVAEAIHAYARGTGLFAVSVYGGAPMHQQIRALERGVDVVVATPGRALDHLGRGTLDLSCLEVVVLDEADEMLDMGFADDIDAILESAPPTRQTALFSATMPGRLRRIAERHLREPVRIEIGHDAPRGGEEARVRQVAYVVHRADKAAALQRVLDMESPASALVFCRTRLDVDALSERLNAHGYRAEALHGGMQQRHREAVMGRFRAGKADLLVATDVAARGLDIEHLSHVLNFDVPSSPEVYVHRIGRTGRAGREGVAITLAQPREHRLLRTIEAFTKQRIETARLPSVADLRARRLELTGASLRERLLAGDLEDVRGLVESLAKEFDVLDVAAAAVKLAQAAMNGGGEHEQELPAPLPPRERGPRDREHGPGARRSGRPGADIVRLFFGAGRQGGVRPADIVGAIAGEAGISSRELGAIEIADRFSLVEVPAARADDIVRAMRKALLRGRRVEVRRDRGP